MKRTLGLLIVALALACRGPQPQTPAPATVNEALTQFLDAVKSKNLTRMGQLWGSPRGPAAETMSDSVLFRRVSVIQICLANHGYRIVEGPLPVPEARDRRLFRVELQRPEGSRVQPIELVQARRGGWLVYDVHLGEAASGQSACRPVLGTRP